MIEFCGGKYSAKRDTHQWVLTEFYEGRGKDGQIKTQSRDTYHASLSQVCSAVIDREAGNCETLSELTQLLQNAVALLTNSSNQQ